MSEQKELTADERALYRWDRPVMLSPNAIAYIAFCLKLVEDNHGVDAPEWALHERLMREFAAGAKSA